MSALPMPRQCFTGRMRFSSFSAAMWPSAMARCETNARLVAPVARPSAPNIGRMYEGCGVGIEAFGSPICAHAMKPPLSTSSGRDPKKAGRHRQRSAHLPTSIDPISCDMPCAMAGLIVYFEM